MNISKDLVFFILPPLKTPCLDFLGCFHCHWLTVLTVGEFPSLTTLGVTVCEQEQTRLGDSLHLCHLASLKERRGHTYRSPRIHPQQGFVMSHGGQVLKGEILGACRGPSLACLFLSLSLPPFLLSFSLDVQRVILPNSTQFTANGQPIPCICACVCTCVCTPVYDGWRWWGECRQITDTVR